LSPVIKALLNASRKDAEQHARGLSAAVANHIGPPPDAGHGVLPPHFARFCERMGVEPLPARPASVALFVLENQVLGIEAASRMVLEISQLHLRNGLADPAAGYPVSTALNRIAKIDPPRSWPAAEKARFTTLPYDLQKYVAPHEAKRDSEIRKAQNRAADAERELKLLKEKQNVIAEEKPTDAAAEAPHRATA
jgi:hypothetical protein